MSLLYSTELIFKRPFRKDEYDKNGRPIERQSFQTIRAIGNLQPYLKGTGHVNLPEGISSESTYVFFTNDLLRGSSQGTGFPADECEIRGDRYIVYHNGDYDQQPMFSAYMNHYEAVLVKKDNRVR